MKRILPVIVVLAMVMLGTGFNQPDARTFYESGLQSMHAKDYINAIGYFTSAISLKPDYADAYYHRAIAKQNFALTAGFDDSEACSDLVMAMRLGNTPAVGVIEKSCLGLCYNSHNAFSDPAHVYCVDFSHKSLTMMPAGTDNLSALIKLTLHNNKFSAIPSNKSLNGLTQLDMSLNAVTSLAGIGRMSFLQDLNMSKNVIATVPEELGQLKNLKHLTLRNNQITVMPRTLASLTQLETMDLAFNKLTNLPVEIANMKSLKTLILVGNDIPASNRDIIKALLPGCTIYFE